MSTDYIPIFFLLFLGSFCKSDDQLTHAKPLTHGDMLISKSGDFALGFFSPTNINTSFYLGVWYHGLPGPRTVVWVANRDNPITTPSHAMLAITTGSDLVLSDSDGHNIWWTSANITAGGASGAHAVLLDSGNFVLRLPNATEIWQSFDHPTDTILPTMRFLFSYREKVVGRLIAWKGLDDPSSGDFSYSIDPSCPDLQAATWKKASPYCRMGVWNGMLASAAILLANTSTILSQTVVNTGDEFYFRYTISDNLPFTRVMLDYTGDMKTLTWDSHSSSWALVGQRPAAACDLYDKCGAFSYCDFTQTVPSCRCLDGFEPNSTNIQRGCSRIAPLKCGGPSHFVPWTEMKVPDNFLHIQNKSFDQCEAVCNQNCSCTAFAYANMSGASAIPDSSRCLVWSGELVDLGKATAGENLYIRLSDTSGI